MDENQKSLSRRDMFQRAGFGIGSIALTSMLQAEDNLVPREPLLPARAKNVIYIHLVGAPSHLDLFDYKPELQKRTGELCPDEFFVGKQLAFIRKQPTLLGTPNVRDYQFRDVGGGNRISNLLPHLQSVGGELSFIRSLHTEQFNHAPAQLMLLTGFGRFGRPSIGSWVNYGLGSENANLPGFVVLVTGQILGAGNSGWGSGFLPTVYQGVEFRSQGDPVLFLSDPGGSTRESRKNVLDAVNKLNRAQLADVGDPEIATRISQYEMAYRMQTSVPELMDIDSEPKHVHEAYGTRPGKVSFANNCLLARRLVERGTRFVQLFDQGWDMHGNVFSGLKRKCKQVDQPIAALIKDLKQRGLLDETLVVWSAEFGRTPMAQGINGLGGANTKAGRDHHKEAYTVWMAGGGVKPGTSYGQSDELGYGIVENPCHVHDLNATILHLLGMDHQRLTYRYQGRPFRLTDIAGEVVHDIVS